MREITLPRYYFVAGRPSLTYGEACAHAANLSDYMGSASVERAPLVKNGEEIEGQASVCHFVKGRQVFPSPILR